MRAFVWSQLITEKSIPEFVLISVSTRYSHTVVMLQDRSSQDVIATLGVDQSLAQSRLVGKGSDVQLLRRDGEVEGRSSGGLEGEVKLGGDASDLRARYSIGTEGSVGLNVGGN